MSDFFGVKISIPPWVVLPLLLLATVIMAYLINAVTLRLLRRAMPQLAAGSDNRFYRLLRGYFFPFLIVGGLLIVLDMAPLPSKLLRVADRLLALSGLVLLIFLLGKAALLILRNIGARYEAMGNIQGPAVLERVKLTQRDSAITLPSHSWPDYGVDPRRCRGGRRCGRQGAGAGS